MRVLNLLAFYAALNFTFTEPASEVSRSPSGASFGSGSTDVDSGSDSDSAPKDNAFISAFKNLKGRRRFTFAKFPKAWNGMKQLAGSPGYVIRLYRARSDNNNSLSFPFTPDSLHFTKNKANNILIESRTSNQNKLCIFTQDPLAEHIDKIESFVQEMISAKDDIKRTKVFKSYKKQMGLPKFAFDYGIHAWVTDSDCAFYNLGKPMRVYGANKAEDQTKTDVASEIIGDTTYTVQVSESFVPVDTLATPKSHPIHLMFMNRYKKDSATFPSIRPVLAMYDSIDDLYKKIIKQYGIIEVTERENTDKKICAALFRKNYARAFRLRTATMPLPHLAYDNERAAIEGATYFRIHSFLTRDLFTSTFEAFSNGEDEIILATWDRINDSCGFPDDESETVEDVDSDGEKVLSTDEIENRLQTAEESTDSDDESLFGSDDDDEYVK